MSSGVLFDYPELTAGYTLPYKGTCYKLSALILIYNAIVRRYFDPAVKYGRYLAKLNQNNSNFER